MMLAHMMLLGVVEGRSITQSRSAISASCALLALFFLGNDPLYCSTGRHVHILVRPRFALMSFLMVSRKGGSLAFGPVDAACNATYARYTIPELMGHERNVRPCTSCPQTTLASMLAPVQDGLLVWSGCLRAVIRILSSPRG
ncbi:hypothetical protein LY76DRAFT_241069 [Colletotrichum caudatum]|nr:hypothetical protein LY76DRAFT_241069 [Colletotrichum caudatum]